MAVGPVLTRKFIIPIYKTLVHDTEANIREISARKVVQFCEILQSTYQDQDDECDEIDKKKIDPIILDEILPLIKALDQDLVEDVQDGLYSVITSLSSLLGEINTKDFLVPLITSSIQNDSCKVKEHIIANLNNIISIIGIDDLKETVQKLMADLVNNSTTVWRTRRNLIVTLSHLAKHSRKDYFNKFLRPLYVKLLNDGVFAVRKVAPLVLPVFVKHFGMTWAKESMVPIFMDFSNHGSYLFRLMSLFGMNELISPTLEDDNGVFQNVDAETPKTKDVLLKVFCYNDILHAELEQDWIKIVVTLAESDEYFNDDIRTYAEEAIQAFTTRDAFQITAISLNELEKHDEEENYLEGILFLIISYFLDIINKLAQDKVPNVRVRAVHTLSKILAFSKKLQDELENNIVVKKILDRIPDEEKEKKKCEIKNKLVEALRERHSFVEFKEDKMDEGVSVTCTESLEDLDFGYDIVEEICVNKTDTESETRNEINASVANENQKTSEQTAETGAQNDTDREVINV